MDSFRLSSLPDQTAVIAEYIRSDSVAIRPLIRCRAILLSFHKKAKG